MNKSKYQIAPEFVHADCVTPALLNSIRAASRARGQKQRYIVGGSYSVLFLLTFLLIYGPRLFGSTVLDVISIVSILAFAYYLLGSRARIKWVRGSTIPIGVFVGLCWYSLVIILFSDHQEFFYPLKFIRAIINYLGVYVVCFWYTRRYGSDAIYVILEHIYWATVIHAAIMVLQYINSDIARFIYTLSGYPRWKSYRVTGLTISYNVLTLVQGFGFLVGIVMQGRLGNREARSLFLFPLSMVILLLSMFLAGRTALYIMLFFAMIALLVGWRKHLLNRRFMRIAVTSCVLLLGLSQLIGDSVMDKFNTLTLPLLMSPIKLYLESGTTEGMYTKRTLGVILNDMYFLPEDPATLWFGSSISGRDSVYINSDVGYILMIFGIGVVGTAAVVAFYIYMLAVGIKWWKYDRRIGFLMIVFTAGVLVLNFKEQTLLTRHAFTLSMLMLCSWHLTKSGPEWHSVKTVNRTMVAIRSHR